MTEPIVIAGTVDVDPERRTEALQAAEPHMKATRAQAGCVDYVWSADPLTPGRIYVFERWEDQTSLEAHFAGPHYLAMRDTIGAFGIRGVDVLKYRVDLKEPVYDPTGKARADFYTA